MADRALAARPGAARSSPRRPAWRSSAPDDFLFLEKNTGRVRRVVNGVLQSAPVLDVAVNNNNERGLLGLAINSESPPHVFLYYTEMSDPDGDGLPDTDTGTPLGNRVYRYTWNAADRRISRIRNSSSTCRCWPARTTTAASSPWAAPTPGPTPAIGDGRAAVRRDRRPQPRRPAPEQCRRRRAGRHRRHPARAAGRQRRARQSLRAVLQRDDDADLPERQRLSRRRDLSHGGGALLGLRRAQQLRPGDRSGDRRSLGHRERARIVRRDQPRRAGHATAAGRRSWDPTRAIPRASAISSPCRAAPAPTAIRSTRG